MGIERAQGLANGVIVIQAPAPAQGRGAGPAGSEVPKGTGRMVCLPPASPAGGHAIPGRRDALSSGASLPGGAGRSGRPRPRPRRRSPAPSVAPMVHHGGCTASDDNERNGLVSPGSPDGSTWRSEPSRTAPARGISRSASMDGTLLAAAAPVAGRRRMEPLAVATW